MEVFSESSTNIETKVAKQNALERIVKLSHTFRNPFGNRNCLCRYALEDDELFNAGIGSQIQSDGKLG
jgi:L-asparaginase